MNTEVMYCNVKQMVERLSWMADRSEKGLRQSGGIMVNYMYRCDCLHKTSIVFRLHD